MPVRIIIRDVMKMYRGRADVPDRTVITAMHRTTEAITRMYNMAAGTIRITDRITI